MRDDKGIDLDALRDTVDTAEVSAMVERELADRADRAEVAAEYAEAGFPLTEEPAVGPDLVPALYLSLTAPSKTDPFSMDGIRDVNLTTVNAHPEAWAVHIASGADGRPFAHFFCTDLATAGVFRRPPVGEEMFDKMWLTAADDTQLRQLRQHLVDTTDDPVRRLDRMVQETRGLTLSADVFGPERSGGAPPNPPVTAEPSSPDTAVPSPPAAERRQRDVDAALPWAEKAVPVDVARYRSDNPRTQAVGQENILLAYDTHHARQWATGEAPAVAVAFADAAAQPDRQTYLDARTAMVDLWNDAGRPTAELAVAKVIQTIPVTSVPDTEPVAVSTSTTHASTPKWDTPERRADTAAALTAAGVDPEDVEAHMLADASQAARLDAVRAPSDSPSATPGERGQKNDRSVDRGDR